MEHRVPFEELAQDGHGIERATRRTSEFLSRLVARIRALCALVGTRLESIIRMQSRARRSSQTPLKNCLHSQLFYSFQHRG
jgi:hypothetical protein